MHNVLVVLIVGSLREGATISKDLKESCKFEAAKAGRFD